MAEFLRRRDEPGRIPVRIGGMAIGNGWTHPGVQYNYGPFASAAGLVGEEQESILREQYEHCQASLEAGATSSAECQAILDMITTETSIPNGAQLNVYDIRLYLKDPQAWPFGIERIPRYLDRRDVRRALHTTRTTHTWTECSAAVNAQLAHEDSISTTPQVEAVLQAGIPTLFYNGQFDLICNHLGTESFLHQLNWAGNKEFVQAKRYVWVHDGLPAGYVKATQDARLQFVVFLGASHMAPMDQPDRALDMIQRFLANTTFKDIEQDYVLSSSSRSNNVHPVHLVVILLVIGASLVAIWAMKTQQYPYHRIH